MARGSSRRISGGKSTQRIGRERKLSGPTFNHGVIGTGTILSDGGAARSDLSGTPAIAKPRSANTKGRIGGTLRRGRS